MARGRTLRFVALVTAAALCGCTGAGPGAPPLEQAAMFPLQLFALPFMILRPFAPLIQSGMQAGMQMAPYALMFCQKDAGDPGFIFTACSAEEGEGLPLTLPMIEAGLAGKMCVERIVAVDLEEIGGKANLEPLLSAMEKNGIRCRCIMVDAGDIIFDDASLDRLYRLLREKGVSLYTTGKLSAAVIDRVDPGSTKFETEDDIARAWSGIIPARRAWE